MDWDKFEPANADFVRFHPHVASLSTIFDKILLCYCFRVVDSILRPRNVSKCENCRVEFSLIWKLFANSQATVELVGLFSQVGLI